MDPRITPANAHVAARSLEGRLQAPRFVDPKARRIGPPVADLLRTPAGLRDRQLLHGESFEVLEIRDGYAFGQAGRDGYVGYVTAEALTDLPEPTHIVAARATHAYPAPDMKRPELCGLSFGTRLRVVSASGNFFETAEGWFVPKPHLRPANAPFKDPVTIAQLFFGTPYLWGGNSAWGIDCSGLVQAAYLACGLPCPGDSDQQEETLGTALPPDSPVQRGDILFWKGHVALAVDDRVMIHANAHHMAVAYEPVADAIARIVAQGDGPLTHHKRLLL
ncbi:NlpC/P60 family protein [Rhodovulum imhoffii]|uniref:NlpC/P60 family protein n=1 Tax=Rhodovulum imhoffii TaxID=365340 RepID=A0A2T5BSG4_9RHOB|nr:C40 family peptidase [Rhodovulum imhoffii]MBK5933479.1 NLP/P60 hydrolase [Rhodovulum imhoffii]PTN02284.1 NlpC/P60 family protein [Rhodovulum imhoffii]